MKNPLAKITKNPYADLPTAIKFALFFMVIYGVLSGVSHAVALATG